MRRSTVGRLLSMAFLGAVLGLPSLAHAQDSGSPPQDDLAAQATDAQATDDQATDAQATDDQTPSDQTPSDQAPAPAPDPSQWWLKQGGSGANDLAITFVLNHDYQEFWQFRTQALAQLDDIYLPEVMAGAELDAEMAGLHQLKADGKAQIVVVENHPEIWYASPDEAVIYDPYVSRSYFVDAKTRKPLGDGPASGPSTVSIAYHLTKHPDHFGSPVWKVDDAVIIRN
jgi:hypothetical protein